MNTRPLAPILALAALLVAALLPAAASAGSSTTELFDGAYVYEEGDLAVVQGPLFDQGCFGEGFPVYEAHVVATPSGISMLRGRVESTIAVYSLSEYAASDVFELIDRACTHVVLGEGERVVPLTVGEGTMTVRLRCGLTDECFAPHSTEAVRNGVIGTVVDGDGGTWRVRASATVDVTYGATPEEPVTEDVVRMTVDMHRIGRR